MDTESRSTPEAKLTSPTSPISKISEATPDSGASQEKATCLKPVKPQPHVAQLPPALKPAALAACVETWFGVKAVLTVSLVRVVLCPFGALTRMSNVSLKGLLPPKRLTQYGYSLLTKLYVALIVYSVPAVTWKGCDRLLNWLKRPVESGAEPFPVERKPMNWPAGAVKSAKVESTVPVPVRFQPGGKRPVSKPPLMILGPDGFETGGTVGMMSGRL